MNRQSRMLALLLALMVMISPMNVLAESFEIQPNYAQYRGIVDEALLAMLRQSVADDLDKCDTVEEIKAVQTKYDTKYGAGTVSSVYDSFWLPANKNKVDKAFALAREDYYARLMAAESYSAMQTLKALMTEAEYAEFAAALTKEQSEKLVAYLETLVPVVTEQEIARTYGDQEFTFEGNMPEDAVFTIKEVAEDAVQKVAEELFTVEENSNSRREFFAFDLSIESMGAKWQPTDGGIEITISGLAPGGDSVEVIHLLDSVEGIAQAQANGTLQQYAEIGISALFEDENAVSSEADTIYYTREAAEIDESGNVTFTASSFSDFYFSVDYMTGEMTLSLFGGSEIYLSELLPKTTLDKEISSVTSVACTGDASQYVSVTQTQGDWLIASTVDFFDARGILTITFSTGETAEINVMDGVTVQVKSDPELVKPGEEIILYAETKYIRSADWQWQVSKNGSDWEDIEGETSDMLFLTTSVDELDYEYRVLASNIVVWTNEVRENQMVSTFRMAKTLTVDEDVMMQSNASSSVMLLSTPVSQDDVTYDITYVTDGGTKQITIDQLPTAIDEINAAGWGHIIFLKSLTLNEPLVFKDAEITLLADQKDTTLTYGGAAINYEVPGFIQIEGGKLILGDKDMAGHLTIDAARKASCAYVIGGDMEMYAKVTLTNGVASIDPNNNGNTYGGGVLVSEGTFEMFGGTIENCYAMSGGGVNAFNDATFIMHDGTIQNCHAYYCGGAVSYEGSTTEGAENAGYVRIRGGQIINNKAGRDGGAIHQNYGTVYFDGGLIKGNVAPCGSAAGIHSSSPMIGMFYINGGEITGNNTESVPASKATVNNGKKEIVVEGYYQDDLAGYGYGGAVKSYGTSMVIMTAGSVHGNTTSLTTAQWDAEKGTGGANDSSFTAPASGKDYDIYIRGGSMNAAISGGNYDLIYPSQSASQYTVRNARSNATYKTLGEAVAEAAEGDTIEMYGNTTETATVEISMNLTIQSMGKVTSTWSAATTQCINISGGADVTFKAIGDTVLVFDANKKARVMQITGASDNIANVTLDGAITLQNGNTSERGGGVHLFGYTTLNLNGGTITSNTAAGNGGGIDASSGNYNVFNMTGGTISKNSASSGGAVRFGSSDNVINITGGTITGNTASASGGAIQMDNGGGNKLTLENCTVHSNSAVNGGAVQLNVNYGTDAVVVFENATIINNKATNGGGLHITDYTNTGRTDDKPMTVTVKNSEIADNVATSNGADAYIGGTLQLQDQVNIGEVYLETDKVIRTLNDITTTTPVYVAVQNADDGRVIVDPAHTAADVSCFASSDTAFTVAQAAGNSKQFILKTDASSGKVRNERTKTEYTTLYEAVAAASAGDTLTVLSSTIEEQAITISKDLTIQAEGDQTCNFVNLSGANPCITIATGTTVTLTSLDENQLTIDANLFGRAIIVNGTLNMEANVVIKDGTTAIGDGATGASYGGGILVNGGTFNMKGGVIEDCIANTGGGVSLYTNGTMNMSGGTIRNNTAIRAAGGIDVGTSYAGNRLTITGGTVENNTAVEYGGGVRMGNTGNQIIISGGKISGNTAGVRGGGIQIDEAADGNVFIVSGGEIIGNSAPIGGGIDFCVNNAANQANPATISGGTISGNTADTGAGVYLDARWALNYTGGTIEANYGDGIGIYADGSVHTSGTPNAIDPIYLAINNTIKKDGTLSDKAFLEVKLQNPIDGADILVKGTTAVAAGDEEKISIKNHSTYRVVHNATAGVAELKTDERFHIVIDAQDKGALNAIGQGWADEMQMISFDMLVESMLPDSGELAKITPSILSDKTFTAEVFLSDAAAAAIEIVKTGVIDGIKENEAESNGKDPNTTFALKMSVSTSTDEGELKDVLGDEAVSTGDMSQVIPYIYFQLYSAPNITKIGSYLIDKVVLTSNTGDTITVKNVTIDLKPPTLKINYRDTLADPDRLVSETYIYGNPKQGGHGQYGDRSYENAGYEFLGWALNDGAEEPLYTADIEITDTWIYEMTGQYPGVGTEPPTLDLYAVWKRSLVNLTISKTGWEKIDENQNYVFNVASTELYAGGTPVNMDVVVTENGSVTIKDLPVGKYTITEDANWSWRYSTSPKNIDMNGVKEDGSDQQNYEVLFENNRIKKQWLDGEAEAKENQFTVNSGI